MGAQKHIDTLACLRHVVRPTRVIAGAVQAWIIGGRLDELKRAAKLDKQEKDEQTALRKYVRAIRKTVKRAQRG